MMIDPFLIMLLPSFLYRSIEAAKAATANVTITTINAIGMVADGDVSFPAATTYRTPIIF